MNDSEINSSGDLAGQVAALQRQVFTLLLALIVVSGTLTVGKAALTITAANASKLYGATLPTFTATYSGFVNGDSASILTTPPTLTTTATAASAARKRLLPVRGFSRFHAEAGSRE